MVKVGEARSYELNSIVLLVLATTYEAITFLFFEVCGEKALKKHANGLEVLFYSLYVCVCVCVCVCVYGKPVGEDPDVWVRE